MIKLLLITEGSFKNGLGHLFRTRTFAKAVNLVCDLMVIAKIDKQLENIFDEIKEITYYLNDKRTILNAAKKFEPSAIIFDMLSIDDYLFYQLKKMAIISVSISPIFSHLNEVDIIFSRTKFNKFDANINKPKVYGGLEYSIFNEFCSIISDQEYKKNINKDVFSISVSMGGVDAPNKTFRIIKSLAKFPYKLLIWVALGEGYSYSFNELVEASKVNKNHEIILAKANISTWNILSNSVLAILAGGLTTIESVYVGLPSISIFESERQFHATSKELFDYGILSYTMYNNEDLDRWLIKKVLYFYNNRDELLKIRELSKNLVDRNGSQRVFNRIKAHL